MLLETNQQQPQPQHFNQNNHSYYEPSDSDEVRSTITDDSIPLVAQPPPALPASATLAFTGYTPILPSITTAANTNPTTTATPMFSGQLSQQQQSMPTTAIGTLGFPMTPATNSPAINSMDTEAVLELKQWLTSAPELLRQSMLRGFGKGEDAAGNNPSGTQHPQQQQQSSPPLPLLTYTLPSNETINCVCWRDNFFITGTDIVKILLFRFASIGRPVLNAKKFEEGVFSDLRNLKPGTDAVLEEPRSAFLEFLYRHGCIRTQKKQKVFYWYRVTHDDLFMDALERDLKREANLMQMNSFILSQRLSKQMAMNISMAAAAANTVNPAAFAAGGPNSMAAMMMGDQHVNGAVYPMMVPGPPTPSIMPNSNRSGSLGGGGGSRSMQPSHQARRAYSMTGMEQQHPQMTYGTNQQILNNLQYQQFQQQQQQSHRQLMPQGSYTNPASPTILASSPSGGYPSSTMSSPGPGINNGNNNAKTASSSINPLMQQHHLLMGEEQQRRINDEISGANVNTGTFTLSDFQDYSIDGSGGGDVAAGVIEYQQFLNNGSSNPQNYSLDGTISTDNPNIIQYDYTNMFADFI